MRVIRDASGSEHRNPVVPSDPREIFPETRLHFLRNNVASFLGAKDAMDEDVRILVGHLANIHICYAFVSAGCHMGRGAVPKGTLWRVLLHPALPCRAFQCRACGTG